MSNNYNQLKEVIRAYLNDNKLDNFSCDVNDILSLASKLNVLSVVSYKLKDYYNNSLIEKAIFKAVNNYEKLENAKSEIIKLFDENKIQYIFLKGSSIGKYYDKPFLRYSSDLDVVVKKETYDKAYRIMINELGYVKVKSAIHEVTLINKNNVNVDFHNSFTFNKNEYENYFSNCYANGNELDDTYKYLYHILHGATHFTTGQLELRYFIDLFYLRNNIERIQINDNLRQLDLFKFDNAVNSYLDYLIGIKNPSSLDRQIDEFIINYSKDKGAKNRVDNNDNRILYFIRHAFPSFKIMKGKYPLLGKMPILLPFFYIYRLFRTIFSKRKEYVVAEIKEGISNNNVSNLINELGISSYNK